MFTKKVRNTTEILSGFRNTIEELETRTKEIHEDNLRLESERNQIELNLKKNRREEGMNTHASSTLSKIFKDFKMEE